MLLSCARCAIHLPLVSLCEDVRAYVRRRSAMPWYHASVDVTLPDGTTETHGFGSEEADKDDARTKLSRSLEEFLRTTPGAVVIYSTLEWTITDTS